MNDTEKSPAITLTTEELTALKENYVTFCNRIAEAKGHLTRMNTALQQNESDLVLELWKPLKDELDQLNTMALQLNKGDYGLLAREQLESLLAECEIMYQNVLNTDMGSDAETLQKAQEAYTSDKPC